MQNWLEMGLLGTATYQLEYNIKLKANFPANIYLFKINNRNTRKRCEICSKITIKAPDHRGDVSC